MISSRSAAADALLDYRDPPSTPRADRIADLEAKVEGAFELGLKTGRTQAAEEIAGLKAEIATLTGDRARLLERGHAGED